VYPPAASSALSHSSSAAGGGYRRRIYKRISVLQKTAKDSQRALSEKLAHLMLSLADRAKPWLSLDWVSRVLDQ
jgi:hypothetical protein